MEKNNMCIAIFSGYYVPHVGGVEKYTYNLAKQFNKMGIKTVIVTTNYENPSVFKIEKEEFADVIYISIYDLFKERYPIPRKNPLLKKKLDEYNIDSIIVNTRFHLTSLVGAKYGNEMDIPVFLVEHGSQHLTIDNKVLDYCGAIYEHGLTWYIKKFVDQYYGVSQGACDWQKHFNIKSNGIWYNSIEDYSSEVKIRKNKDGNINILYAGRIIKQKGIIELLNAFKKLEKNHKNIYLTIAGDGNLYESLKNDYKSNKITFLGRIDYEKLKKIYSYTDILVYAPLWPEGLPTTILEAGVADCAVIASPQGGIKEIIDENTGVLVNNENELLSALELLIEDKKMREKLACSLHEKILSDFTWEATSEKVIDDIKKYIRK